MNALKKKLTVVETERCVGCQSCMFACSRRQGEAGLTNHCIAVRSIGGMERGFTVVVCHACENPPCANVCPTDALKKRKGGGVLLNADACIGCGNCLKACLIGAIEMDKTTMKPAICIHCGYCVSFCPHNVLGYNLAKNGEVNAK